VKKELPLSVVLKAKSFTWFILGGVMPAASYQQGGRRKMKEEHILRYTRGEIDTIEDETDWIRVDAMTDEEVYAAALSDPDAQPTDTDFWQDAKIIDASQAILRVEPDILEWFKTQGGNYQARMNAILRDYVEAHR
jgi:uncharacterized protein (DUF4415 family)